MFETDYPGAVAAFKGEALFTLRDGHARFVHVLGQLDGARLWHRPHPGMNAVGNLVLHVCGNLTQWVVVGCDPDRALADTRDRRAEFTANRGVAADLTRMLNDTVAAAADVLGRLNKDHLLEPRTIQEFGVTGLGAVWHSVAHMQAHAQESVYAARLVLGADYRPRDAYGVDRSGA